MFWPQSLPLLPSPDHAIPCARSCRTAFKSVYDLCVHQSCEALTGHIHCHAYYTGICNSWMFEQQCLQLSRCDLVAFDLDQFLSSGGPRRRDRQHHQSSANHLHSPTALDLEIFVKSQLHAEQVTLLMVSFAELHR
ncbi:hypothetical protein KCU85_g414, partial [Aureobasidium melanogenum]